MRSALAGLVRGFLGALSFWCIALAILIGVAILMASAFAAGWCYSEHRRGREALDATIARLAARGELVTIASKTIEAKPRHPRIAIAADRLRDLSRDAHVGRKWPKCRELLGGKSARVGWRAETPPTHNGPLSWEDVSNQLQIASVSLEEIRTALASDDAAADTIADEGDDRAIVPWLAWSVMERLHSLDPEGAVRDVTAIRRLADRHALTPSLDSQLWRCALLKSGIRLSWEVLQAPALTDPTLGQLQALWSHDDTLEGIIATLRRERSVGVSGFATLIRTMETNVTWKKTLDELGTAVTGRRDSINWIGETSAWFRYAVWRLLWADDELACFLNALQVVIDRLGERENLSWTSIREAWATAEERLAGNPGRLGLDRLVVGVGGLNGGRAACQVILECEAERRMLLVDIARSRFELYHGRTPASIAELVPLYLSSVPADPMDGLPIRYQLGDKGEPVIYSIGPDCRDDKASTQKADATQATAVSHGRDMVWPIADFARSIE